MVLAAAVTRRVHPRLFVMTLLIASVLVTSLFMTQIWTLPAINSVGLMACTYGFCALKFPTIDRRLFTRCFVAYCIVFQIAGLVTAYLRLTHDPIMHGTQMEWVDGPKYVGIFFNTNQAGVFLCASALLGLLVIRNIYGRAAFVLGNFVLLLWTVNRSGIIALFLGLMILLGGAAAKQNKRVLFRRVALPIVVALVALLLIGYFDQDIREKVLHAGMSGRMNMWRSVWRDFVDSGDSTRWLFGGGAGSTRVDTSGVLGTGLTAHNSFLQVLSDYGAIVLTLCLAHLGLMIASVRRDRRLAFLALCLPALSIGVVETQLFLGGSYLWIVLLTGFHLVNANDPASPGLVEVAATA